MNANIENMTAEQLLKLKNKWYEDANKRTGSSISQIEKLWLIAEELGERLRHNYGPKYEFAYDDIKIYVDNYGNYLTVKKGDKLIVSTHNEKLYVYGVLEPFINVWYPEAKKRCEDRAAENQSKRKSELANMLCI